MISSISFQSRPNLPCLTCRLRIQCLCVKLIIAVIEKTNMDSFQNLLCSRSSGESVPSLLERPLYARPIANITNPSLDSVLIHQRKKWKLLIFVFTNHLRVDCVQNLTHLPVWKQRTWKWEFKSSWLIKFLQAPLNMKHPRNTVNVTPDMFITKGHIPWYMFN